MLALSLSANLRGTPSVHPLWVKIHEIAEGKLIGVFLYIKFWAILKNVYSSLSSFF